MNIRQLTDNIRYKMKYGSTVEWYNFWYIVLRRRQKVIPQVASIDETIRQIASERCSVSRFGDGEILLTQASEKHWFPERRPRTCREAQGSAKKPRTRASGLCVGRISTFRTIQPESTPLLADTFFHLRPVVGLFTGSRTKILQHVCHSSLHGLASKQGCGAMVPRHESHLGRQGHRFYRRRKKPSGNR